MTTGLGRRQMGVGESFNIPVALSTFSFHFQLAFSRRSAETLETLNVVKYNSPLTIHLWFYLKEVGDDPAYKAPPRFSSLHFYPVFLWRI